MTTPTGGEEHATRTGHHAAYDVPVGAFLAERFRILGVLGIGGMGVVYRAHDDTLGIDVAVKLLRPEFARRDGAFERFRQEILLARQVSSPHVVRIHDIARHGDRWLIGMDLVEGRALDRELDQAPRMPLERALDIALDIARGLEAAHARGVVHRDLKPANVLVDTEGRAYISDFGIARSLAGSGLTHTGQILGTPDYLSPEQARGDPVDARSDLYSLGLILYEMLSGKLPFADGTSSESLARRMLRAPRPIRQERPEVPPWLERLLDRMLQPSPARRPASAAEVVAALRERRAPAPRHPRRAMTAAVAAIAVAAASLLAYLGLSGWPDAAGTADTAARVLVMPAHDADGDPATLAALAEHVRTALAQSGMFAVVDADRTAQALGQLGSAASRPRAVADLAVAGYALVLDTAQADAGLVMTGTLSPPDASLRLVRTEGDTDAREALLAFLPRLSRALDVEALPLSALPAGDDALTAYGRALVALRERDADRALEASAQATAADPNYVLAWLARADAGVLAGAPGVAASATEAARRVAVAESDVLGLRIEAMSARVASNPSRAAGAWRQLARSRPDDLVYALRHAEALGDGGDFAQAVERLQAIVDVDPDDPRAWYLLGKFSILRGELRAAIDDYLVRALVLFTRGRDTAGEAETSNALGIGYARLGQPDAAIERYERALVLQRTLGDRRGIASTLRNLASLESARGEIEQAEARLAEVRGLYLELDDRAGLAGLENQLGRLYEEQGRYRAALVAFNAALSARRQLGDEGGVAESLNDVGFAQFQLGDHAAAEAFWRQAGAAFDALGDLNGQVRVQQNLGLLATVRGDWPQARVLLDASLDTATAQQMIEERAVALRNLAELDLVQGRGADASRNVARAWTLFAEGGDRRGLNDTLLLQARIEMLETRPDRASAILDLLEPELLPDASLEQQALAALLRAQIATRAGAPDAAARVADARRHAARSEMPGLQLHVDLLAAGHDRARLESLAAPVARLGDAELQFQLAMALMRSCLEAGDAEAALASYAGSQRLLAGGESVHAVPLHALAAEAHAAHGDPAAAEAARARRAEAAARRQHAPALALPAPGTLVAEEQRP